MNWIDLQVHSSFSHDGKASLREHCLRAVELGLAEIGFSEHKDFEPTDPVVGHFNYDAYMRGIEEVRTEFAGALTIRAGVEIDYRRTLEEETARFLDSHPFDYVLGAVHYVDGCTVMTPEYLENRDAVAAYRDYFDEVEQSLKFGRFTTLAHLEYAKRRGVPALGPFDIEPHREQVAELMALAVKQGIVLEINSAGLRQGVGQTYPCLDTVALYREAGGEDWTFGSDAHHPDDLFADAEAAYSIAERFGLRLVSFAAGQRAPL